MDGRSKKKNEERKKMRDIKFRIFINGTMYYPPFDFMLHDGEFNTHLTGVEVLIKGSNKPVTIDGEIMEWTTMFDNTGKRIYEGDIVTYKTSNSKGKLVTVNAEVFWSKNAWHIIWFVKKDSITNEPLYEETGLYMPESKTFGNKVIGNIWENKHLLEEKVK